MANLFLDQDLNQFIAKNTMSKDQFLAAQKELEEEEQNKKTEKLEEKEG